MLPLSLNFQSALLGAWYSLLTKWKGLVEALFDAVQRPHVKDHPTAIFVSLENPLLVTIFQLLVAHNLLPREQSPTNR